MYICVFSYIYFFKMWNLHVSIKAVQKREILINIKKEKNISKSCK